MLDERGVVAEIDGSWIVLEGLTSGVGASIVQKAAPHSKFT